MFEQAYRYRFADQDDLREAGRSLLLAILAAKGLFGGARVRMDAGYAVDPSILVLVVDGSTQVGQAINRILTAFLSLEFGPDGFDVLRVQGIAGGIRQGGGQ